ncbi:MAG: peptidoglycan DD-metalloendopeptidase family protein [Alphaproteobacteria bacterium]|nr:peptidoglycan DD-metalloendopeptidase family protein [Alphaproteobacteria bacterium]
MNIIPKRQAFFVVAFVALYLVTVGIFHINNPQGQPKHLSSRPFVYRAEAPVAASNSGIKQLDVKVRNGDNFGSILKDAGISDEDSYAALQSLKSKYDPTQLSIGQEIKITRYDIDRKARRYELRSLTIVQTPQIKHTTVRTHSDDFITSTTIEPTVKKTFHAVAEIKDSLFNAGTSAGIPVNILMEIIKSYSYDVDFQRDIKPGDKLEILFDRYYTESGEWVRDGSIMYSSLRLASGKPLNYYYFQTPQESGFYNENGFSIRKSILRTPINGARITSGFGMRMHPLLGYTKMHKGVDFGAPVGTPIYAAGDGKVVKIGVYGGYGNYIQIKHNNEFSTAYAHISRFAKNVTNGVRVKQGQVIAYVGSTGRSTGPHLHFELLRLSQPVDPKSIKAVPQMRLAGKDFKRFENNREHIHTLLTSLPSMSNMAEALPNATEPKTSKQ